MSKIILYFQKKPKTGIFRPYITEVVWGRKTKQNSKQRTHTQEKIEKKYYQVKKIYIFLSLKKIVQCHWGFPTMTRFSVYQLDKRPPTVHTQGQTDFPPKKNCKHPWEH